jgi:hypothetical protein
VTSLERLYDRVGVIVPGGATAETVLVVQETAYPGWSVYVDGQPAKLESVGQLIGVVLPPSSQPQQVYFEFRPTLSLVSGWITVFSAVIAGLYMLRADRFIPKRFTELGEEAIQKAVSGAAHILMNDTLLTPKDEDDEPQQDVVLLPARTETRPEQETKLLEAAPEVAEIEDSVAVKSSNGSGEQPQPSPEESDAEEVPTK